jgi:hypothetical protein
VRIREKPCGRLSSDDCLTAYFATLRQAQDERVFGSIE